MTSEHAERTSVSSHANAGETLLNRRLPYGASRTPSSASSSSVSGSLPVHVSPSPVAAASSSTAVAASGIRTVPAGSTTSSVTVTTTASGEIKMTRRRRRPNESYSTIIIKAIRNSPLQRLKLSEIYDYVSREIPTMDGNDKGWQNTVRHNLSHNKCFRRIVIKDEDLPLGSADDDDGESKQSASSSTGKSSKQAKRGKGGCWVLVPENLEESMPSSRPKKSLTDQGQSPAAPGAESESLSSTSPRRQHSSIKATATTTGASYLSPQLSKEYALSHPNSSVTDIDRNVASMMIAEQQLQQSGRHHGPHMHSSHYSPPHPHSRQQHPSFSHSHSQPNHQQHHGSFPYFPPRYHSISSSSPTPSSGAMMSQPGSTSSAASRPDVPTSHPSQLNYSSSGDDRDNDSESDDGQSRQSDLSVDRDIVDEDYEGDEIMEDDFGSQSSSSRHSPSRSPSASSLSAASYSMDIERNDGGDGGLSSSSSPTTGRRPGMSIQNMLN
ncbi:hypothetical protein BGX24_005080 [Mortierella sp. AD032]|nr:hypothetical protein BGX24_005080 [Mortierella sp. AD032]